MLLFLTLSAWCLFVTAGMTKLWLDFMHSGIVRGQRGYIIRRSQRPAAFWGSMAMMGFFTVFAYGIAAVFLREALF